jgi:hypothetical protein
MFFFFLFFFILSLISWSLKIIAREIHDNFMPFYEMNFTYKTVVMPL